MTEQLNLEIASDVKKEEEPVDPEVKRKVKNLLDDYLGDKK